MMQTSVGPYCIFKMILNCHVFALSFFIRQKMMRGIGCADFGHGDLAAPSKLLSQICLVAFTRGAM